MLRFFFYPYEKSADRELHDDKHGILKGLFDGSCRMFGSVKNL